MNNAQLEKLLSRNTEKITLHFNYIQQMQEEATLKRLSPPKTTNKDNQWLMKKKILPESPNKNKSNLKLDHIQRRSNFSSYEKTAPLAKNNSDKLIRYQNGNPKASLSPEEEKLIESKLQLETVGPKRIEPHLEKKNNNYIAHFLPKGDEKELVYIDQANEHFHNIKPFMWNVIVSVFHSITRAIKKANIPLAKRLATAYLNMHEEVVKSQEEVLFTVEDPTHISLICQSFYLQRIVALILSINLKVIELDQPQLLWVAETIKKILTIRSLILEIVNEYEQIFVRYNKLKKPSYLIRQKKLISINKIMTTHKEAFNKFIKQSEANKFNFDVKMPLTHEEVINKTNSLKLIMLRIPIPPYLTLNVGGYYLVIDPEGIFYTEDMKKTCIYLKSYTEHILKALAALCHIILFSKRRQKYLQPFLKETQYIQYQGVLDRSHETYREGKKIKDLSKIGINTDKALVLDIHYQKSFFFHKKNCIPISKNFHEEDLNYIVEVVQIIVRESIPIVNHNTIAYLLKKQSNKHHNVLIYSYQ